MLSPGAIIGTRYKVIRLLGQGGMSNIYVCEELTPSGSSSGQVWAVKEFTATYADPREQQAALANFQREAYLLGQLSHPNLPKIRDYFQFQGKYYLAMEYLQGSDLGKILEREGSLPELKVADLGLQMTTVLYYLHCQKPTPIIFRDVKPSNIILCGDKIKLIDFGIARLFTPGKRGDTMRIGSPGYAPPEQYTGQTDLRSDIYALGMTLHQCLTGQDPTLSPNPFVVTPVLKLKPQVSPELAAIVQKAIELIPEKRYQSMLEMKEDLRRFLKVGRSSSPLSGVASVIPSSTAPSQSSAAVSASPSATSTQVSASKAATNSQASSSVLPIPPFTPTATEISNVATLTTTSTTATYKGGTSIVSSSATFPTPNISAPIGSGATVATSASTQLSKSNAATVPNFGPPVIVPVDDDEVPGAWKKNVAKLFMGLVAWGFLAAACAVVFGLVHINLPNLHEPFNSRRAALVQSIQPFTKNLSPDNYDDVYKYTINRLKAAEVLESRVKSEPQDFLAKALKQNLDNLLCKRYSSFVGNAEYEKLYKNDLDKIGALSDPSGLYLDSKTQAFLLGPTNTISLVLPKAQDVSHTDSPLARGSLAAQEVLQSCAISQGKGVMINPIFNPKSLSLNDVAYALNEQLCQAAPIPKAGQLNSQIIISEHDISQTWRRISESNFSLTSQLQPPTLYLDLSKNDKLPSLTELVGVSVRQCASSTPVFILEKGFVCKFTAKEKSSWPKNCHFIGNWQELSTSKSPNGLVLISPSQLKSVLSLPSQYKIAIVVPTPATIAKLRTSLPTEWIAKQRVSIWSLTSYQHPHKQALAILNSSLLDEQTTADLDQLYKTLKAADAFTLGALRLRQAQGSFSGSLANYNLDNGTFAAVSCQVFNVTTNGLRPVVFPSPRQSKLEE